jgi:hypothetical protein
MYYSQACQDEFVYKILNKQSIGVFVDIGSNDPIHYNNSYFLETIGWNGICVDIKNFDYTNRKCKFYNIDALTLDYKKLFVENNFNGVIDYLSIDIDYYTSDCLSKIPLNLYKFKVITIEHDSYRYGLELKSKEIELLHSFGYHMMCENVTCLPLSSTQFFEDWWVNPDFVDVNNFKSKNELCTNIVKRFDLI